MDDRKHLNLWVFVLAAIFCCGNSAYGQQKSVPPGLSYGLEAFGGGVGGIDSRYNIDENFSWDTTFAAAPIIIDIKHGYYVYLNIPNYGVFTGPTYFLFQKEYEHSLARQGFTIQSGYFNGEMPTVPIIVAYTFEKYYERKDLYWGFDLGGLMWNYQEQEAADFLKKESDLDESLQEIKSLHSYMMWIKFSMRWQPWGK